MSNNYVESSREKRQHSTLLVPYSYYDCHIPDAFVNVPMHWHEEFEINYVLRGNGEFICGDNKFNASQGDILIIPPNMLHAAYPGTSTELLYDAFVFSPIMIDTNNNDRSTLECIRPVVNGNSNMQVIFTPKDSFYPELQKSVENIYQSVQNNDAVSDILLKSELLRIFWLLENNKCIKPHDQSRVSCSEIIRPALEYMNSFYKDVITIDQLAKSASLSKSYFMSCFRKAVGIGAIEYLSQLRIKAACELLRDTTDSVSDISFNCGYNNLSNFNRQFRKIVGCSPLKCRNDIAI